jgi:hypothetical protein
LEKVKTIDEDLAIIKMIDKELSNYILQLFRKGYSMKSINETLITAGHDVSKVEKLSLAAFEKVYRPMINYFDAEFAKGKSAETIGSELLKMGHSSMAVNDVLAYHKTKHPFFNTQSLTKFFSKDSSLFNNWLKLSLCIVLIIIVIFALLSLVINMSKERKINLDQKLKICESLKDSPYHKSLCLALVHSHPDLCVELKGSDINDCTDAYYIYTFYRLGDITLCSSINNINLKNVCQQISDKRCNTYFDYEGICDSISLSDISLCSQELSPVSNGPLYASSFASPSPEKHPIIGTCNDNYYIYQAIKKDKTSCNQVEDDNQKAICLVLGRT